MKALEIVEGIVGERRRGSTALAWMVLEAYRKIAEESDNLQRDVPPLSDRIAKARPAMPLVKRFNDEVLKRVKRYEFDEIVEACRQVETAYRMNVEKLVENAEKQLAGCKTITTISHSGTVLNILKKVDTVRDVFVLESRPLREGLIMASELKRLKRVTVCVDAAAGYAVDASEAALVGGDALFPDGSFAGKVGVRPLALLAKEAGKPFYVACDTWKYAERFENEHGPAEEVSAENGLSVFNPVFEKVGKEHVYMYLTEKGAVKPDAVKDVVI
ncbi:MAG: hypothetical protein QW614_05880 [Candidatus Caldarchaeum sp.]|uniref:Translation initiation factor eIF-2B n=1 Tax=Caldiarchaeum subterraneum TaxID=311458 RepID=A0A7C5LD09_CALS0